MLKKLIMATAAGGGLWIAFSQGVKGGYNLGWTQAKAQYKTEEGEDIGASPQVTLHNH